MIDIKILLENTLLSSRYIKKHGLSIYINTGKSNILLDVGPDQSFYKNANKMNIDISSVDFLLLSHSHSDHVGGLDVFCEVNKKSSIFLFDDLTTEYYSKILGDMKIPVGIKCNEETKGRINSITTNIQIDSNTWFIKNTENKYRKPKFNMYLYKQNNNGFILDDFNHEGILVIEDNGELIVFNSCSHNGVVNSIESVKKIFNTKKIRSYIGGFHFFNPITLQHEDNADLDMFIEYVNKEQINFYTGHCTGRYSFNYLQKKAEKFIHKIQTGSELIV
jgi:7,8-dihydropterin-6-yl-methyl-4-(beta-D-ribofuranosyl)aminobenzene 5'-phosphate synthase